MAEKQPEEKREDQAYFDAKFLKTFKHESNDDDGGGEDLKLQHAVDCALAAFEK